MYLGLDCSTQQLKAVILCGDADTNLKNIRQFSISYDADLPEFGTKHGVHRHSDGSTVTTPPQLWIRALDLLCDRMKQQGVDFSLIRAISGAGQQHGSVYWRQGAKTILNALDPKKSLHEQLKDGFSINDSPIWMDSSTENQCRKLENAVGGPLKLAEITGSRAYHRFTGAQIAKIAQNRPEFYEKTERISLVSSFVCSLFVGDFAPIDFADGSGMNLMDIRTKRWDDRLLNAVGPDLAAKLGDPVPTLTSIGRISSYFVQRYGFDPNCMISAFTGDNPASMVGTNLQRGDVAISLGTSDTVLVWLDAPKASLNMHVLCNALDSEAFVGMLCFKNGALTRERVCRDCGCKNWDEFASLLKSTPPGNFGNVGFFYDFPEILPEISAGDRRFNADGVKVPDFEPAVEARAAIEGQILAKRFYANSLGFGESKRILATGGASANFDILQILADVFGSPAYVQDIPNSAAVGAALLAQKIEKKTKNVAIAAEIFCAARPNPANVAVYRNLLEIYQKLTTELF